METWSGKIAALEAAGWSQKELGAAIGLTPQSVSDIKNEQTKAPNGMAAVKLHDLFLSLSKRGRKARVGNRAKAGAGG